MKRIITTAALVAAFAAPSISTGSADQSGPVARGGPLEISLKLIRDGNTPVAIRRFRFKNLHADCDSGGPIKSRGRISYIRVRGDRTFAKNVDDGSVRFRVVGKVRRNRVVGKIRASGDYGTATNCRSGTVRWAVS